MASKRSDFARLAEIRRCIRLVDHYAEQGWPARCELAYSNLLRLWKVDDQRLRIPLQADKVTRKWWIAKAYAKRIYFPSPASLMPVALA